MRAAAIAATMLASLTFLTGSALAWGPGAPNPPSNFPEGSLPPDCYTAPTGATCLAASVDYLNQARANLGQAAYILPSNFDSLTPVEQAFVLTNDDRLMYGLPPVSGLASALNADAAAGVQSDSDPQASGSNWWGYTANWAGGFQNIVLAYGAWMYDDGQGTGNLDCTPTNTSGCWGHRQDILWQFGSGGPLAMGAAAGTDPGGMSGYAMLIAQDSPGAHPAYTYTWAQAVADGAGGPDAAKGLGAGGPAGPAAHAAATRVRFRRLRVHGHRLVVTLSAPAGAVAQCVLRHRTRQGWRTIRVRRCSATTTFSHLGRGVFRLRIVSGHRVLVRRVAVP